MLNKVNKITIKLSTFVADQVYHGGWAARIAFEDAETGKISRDWPPFGFVDATLPITGTDCRPAFEDHVLFTILKRLANKLENFEKCALNFIGEGSHHRRKFKWSFATNVEGTQKVFDAIKKFKDIEGVDLSPAAVSWTFVKIESDLAFEELRSSAKDSACYYYIYRKNFE